MKTWITFSIALFVVWAVVLAVRWKLQGNPTFSSVLLVFFGFFIGWLTCTIKLLLMRVL